MRQKRNVAMVGLGLILGAGGCLSDASGDAVPPVVSISSPLNNATVTGVVNISAQASDNTGVAVVQFYAGTTLLGEDEIPPYAWLWNTAGQPAGLVQLKVVALDAAGNSGQAVVTVTVAGGSE